MGAQRSDVLCEWGRSKLVIEESERFQETRGRSNVQYPQWESCRNTGKIQGGLSIREENSQSGAGGCLWGSQEAPGTTSRRNRNAILKKRAWEFYGTYFHTNKKTNTCTDMLMSNNIDGPKSVADCTKLVKAQANQVKTTLAIKTMLKISKWFHKTLRL